MKTPNYKKNILFYILFKNNKNGPGLINGSFFRPCLNSISESILDDFIESISVSGSYSYNLCCPFLGCPILRCPFLGCSFFGCSFFGCPFYSKSNHNCYELFCYHLFGNNSNCRSNGYDNSNSNKPLCFPPLYSYSFCNYNSHSSCLCCKYNLRMILNQNEINKIEIQRVGI